MIEQISTKSVPNNFAMNQYEQGSNFGAGIPAMPNDSFQSTTTPQVIEKKTFFGWFDGLCLATAGGSLFMWKKGHTNIKNIGKKLSETFEKLGKKTPENLTSAAEELGTIATKDALSGLNNRATFDAALAKHVKEATESGKDLHMAMLDMDFFKSINEILGHTTGDDFIKHISRVVTDVCQENGINAYRYGGEEIAVLMPGHNQESATQIIQKIADKIKTDEKIQGHKGKFITDAKTRLDGFNTEQSRYDEMWKSIRKQDQNQPDVAKTVLKFLGENPEVRPPSEREALEKARKELLEIQRTGQGNVQDVIGKHHALATALNIQNNRKKEIADIKSWLEHVEHNGFTISAGIAGKKSDAPEELLKRTNSALEVNAKRDRNTVAVAKE